MSGEQKFQASYSYSGVQGTTRMSSWFVRKGDTFRYRIDGSLAGFLKEHAPELTVEEETYETKGPTEAWGDAIREFESERREWFDGYSYSAIITTPTREGIALHTARRREFEKFLRRHGVEFSVNCATLHTDLVCRLAGAEEADGDVTANS